MKSFITRFLIFILPILLLATGAELLLRGIPNVYKSKRAAIEKNGDEFEVLVLGSSHALFGVDPQYFSRPGFNAAQISQTVDYDLAILQQYFDQTKELKMVVLPVSLFTFHSLLEMGAEDWRKRQYELYYDIYEKGTFFRSPLEVMIDAPMKTVKRIKRYYIKHEINGRCSASGFGLDYKSGINPDPAAGGAEAAERHRDMVDAGDYERVMGIMNELLECTKERNISVLLFTPPGYISYTSALNPNLTQTMVDTAETLAAQYEHVSYINLLENKMFELEDFYDPDHLNEIGAKKFSQYLGRKIERILIAGEQP